MKKLLNEWRKYLKEESRVVKPTEGTPEALRKSREEGHAKAAAERKKLNDTCNASITAITKDKGEEDLPSKMEMACLKNRSACKSRCVNCKHKGSWMHPESKC